MKDIFLVYKMVWHHPAAQSERTDGHAHWFWLTDSGDLSSSDRAAVSNGTFVSCDVRYQFKVMLDAGQVGRAARMSLSNSGFRLTVPVETGAFSGPFWGGCA